jgi:hypothetical protein
MSLPATLRRLDDIVHRFGLERSTLQLTGINQLWVADITYIRLKAELSIWR